MAIIKPNNNTLSAITALPTGLGGKVLQVINATSTTEVVESGSSFTDTGLSAAITPSSSSNKILISAHIQGVGKDASGYVTLKLLRGSTDIVANFENRGGDTDTSNTNKVGGCSVTSTMKTLEETGHGTSKFMSYVNAAMNEDWEGVRGYRKVFVDSIS